MRRLRRTWVKFVLGATLVAGLVGGVGQAASAHGPRTSFFVSPTGTGGACRKTSPCSLTTATTLATGSDTVHLAKGDYTDQVTLGPSAAGITLIGSGDGSTVISPPATGLSSAPDTDTSDPQYYVIYVSPGGGVHLKDLAVDGTPAIGFFDSTGLGCAQDFVGIYVQDAVADVTNVQVDGIDMPSDLAGCQQGLGIYVASNAGDTSNATIKNVSLPTPADASFGGPVYPAYDKNGITCDDTGTECTISSSTVQGMGPTGLVAQNGIQVFGALASVSHVDVSNDTYTGGGAGNEAAGVLALNAQDFSVTSSDIEACDNDIYAGVVPSYGLMPPSLGTWLIEHNVASYATDAVSGGQNGYGEGIELDSTTNDVMVDRNTTNNDTQAGIYLLGATGVTVSDNSGQKNEVGLYVGGPGTAVAASTSNTITGNTFRKNSAGVIVDGAYDPAPPVGIGPNPGAASGNVFGSNVWTDNLVNAADFSGWAGSDPQPILDTWGSPANDSCEPTAGGSAALDAATGSPYLYAC